MINKVKSCRGRGFTLVELLAVIVILAIILVIAVPKVMNVIEDATKASFESSAKMAASQVENQYTVAQTLGKEFGDTGSCMQEWAGLNTSDYESCTYEITSNGEAQVTLVGKGKFKDLSVCKGTRNSATATEDDSCLPKNLSRVATTSTDLGVTSIHACATSGICEPGTAFAIKVSDTETYKFYVINDDGSKVTLIMNENLGDSVEWISKEDYDEANADDNTECDGVCIDEGPITALYELNERTKDWNNLDSFDYTLVNEDHHGEEYNTYNYEPMEITSVKARMITELEIYEVAGNSSFLPDYLNSSSNYYWTSSAFKRNQEMVWLVQNGVDYLINAEHLTLGTEQGLRPVIEVKK